MGFSPTDGSGIGPLLKEKRPERTLLGRRPWSPVDTTHGFGICTDQLAQLGQRISHTGSLS